MKRDDTDFDVNVLDKRRIALCIGQMALPDQHKISKHNHMHMIKKIILLPFNTILIVITIKIKLNQPLFVVVIAMT